MVSKSTKHQRDCKLDLSDLKFELAIVDVELYEIGAERKQKQNCYYNS
jgi:hypothetical protein